MRDADVGAAAQKWAEQFNGVCECPECKGQRLKKESLHFLLDGQNIAQVSALDLGQLYEWLENLDEKLTERQRAISSEIIKEIKTRLRFLLDVGLDYLSLSRPSMSLSGGESQRIKLAYFLSMNDTGSKVKNQKILFIFDEPTTGLHFYDVEKLLKSFDALLAKGHSIVVVEHNLDVIRAADWVIDLGPEAGDAGGNLVFAGTPEQLLECEGSYTARYLR